MSRSTLAKSEWPKCGKCGTKKFGTPRGWVCPNNLECGERIMPYSPGSRPDDIYNTTDEEPNESGEMTCPKCKGTGELDCDECDGFGEVECGECGHEHDCDECSGYGTIECKHCDGVGTLDKAVAHMERARKAGEIKQEAGR